MDHNIDISFIVLEYHNLDMVLASIDNIKKKSSDLKTEIIISSNSNYSIFNQKKLKKNNPQIIWLFNDTNLGFAGGMNYVLKNMLPLGFDYFLILNNDIIASQNLIKNLVAGAKAKSFDVSSPLIYYYPQKAKLWSHGFYYNKITGIVTINPIPFLPYNCFYLTGCCMLVRREVFEKIGLFDESRSN